MVENIVQAVVISVICLVITTLVGIIGYFLKQTMARVDANEKDVADIRENYEPAKAHEKDAEAFNKKLDDIEKEVKSFKDTYLEKEDFIRNMAEINHKFDRMDDKLDRVIALLNREGK